MLKIKLTINSTSVNANGVYIDAYGEKCTIDLDYDNEENALLDFQIMRDNGAEFSLVTIRSV